MYDDVIVSVSTHVLVIEAECVQELVHDGAVPRDAAVHQRDALTAPNHSDVGRTPAIMAIVCHDNKRPAQPGHETSQARTCMYSTNTCRESNVTVIFY